MNNPEILIVKELCGLLEKEDQQKLEEFLDSSVEYRNKYEKYKRLIKESRSDRIVPTVLKPLFYNRALSNNVTSSEEARVLLPEKARYYPPAIIPKKNEQKGHLLQPLLSMLPFSNISSPPIRVAFSMLFLGGVLAFATYAFQGDSEQIRRLNDEKEALNEKLRWVNEAYELLEDKNRLIQEKLEQLEKSQSLPDESKNLLKQQIQSLKLEKQKLEEQLKNQRQQSSHTEQEDEHESTLKKTYDNIVFEVTKLEIIENKLHLSLNLTSQQGDCSLHILAWSDELKMKDQYQQEYALEGIDIGSGYKRAGGRLRKDLNEGFPARIRMVFSWTLAKDKHPSVFEMKCGKVGEHLFQVTFRLDGLSKKKTIDESNPFVSIWGDVKFEVVQVLNKKETTKVFVIIYNYGPPRTLYILAKDSYIEDIQGNRYRIQQAYLGGLEKSFLSGDKMTKTLYAEKIMRGEVMFEALPEHTKAVRMNLHCREGNKTTEKFVVSLSLENK